MNWNQDEYAFRTTATGKTHEYRVTTYGKFVEASRLVGNGSWEIMVSCRGDMAFGQNEVEMIENGTAPYPRAPRAALIW